MFCVVPFVQFCTVDCTEDQRAVIRINLNNKSKTLIVDKQHFSKSMFHNKF